MQDYDNASHEVLAARASELRAERYAGASEERTAEINAELSAIDAAARKRPQTIVGFADIGRMIRS